MNKLVFIILIMIMIFLLTPLYVCAMSHTAQYEMDGEITVGNEKIKTEGSGEMTKIAPMSPESNLETNPSELIPLEKDDSQKEGASSTASDEVQDISNEQVQDSILINSFSKLEALNSFFPFMDREPIFKFVVHSVLTISATDIKITWF